jgi:hypothetical protein
MKIRFDEQGFGDETRTIPWDDVSVVGIRTTSEGPFREDVFWQFVIRGDAFFELPGSLIDGAALDVMQEQLAGLDSRNRVGWGRSCASRVGPCGYGGACPLVPRCDI